MRQVRRGATLRRRGPLYACPIAESEERTDDRGHRYRADGAQHAYTRLWEPGELEQARQAAAIVAAAFEQEAEDTGNPAARADAERWRKRAAQ